MNNQVCILFYVEKIFYCFLHSRYILEKIVKFRPDLPSSLSTMVTQMAPDDRELNLTQGK